MHISQHGLRFSLLVNEEQGIVTMVSFGIALARHNEFLGYHGDYDEGAKACFKTAGVFGMIAILSVVTFAVSAVRQKMSHGVGSRNDYVPV